MGSGLNAWIGGAVESTYGTPVTVNTFWEFTSESLRLTKGTVQGGGLRGGAKYRPANRRLVTARGGEGDITMELPAKGLGKLLRAMTGSNPTPTASGPGYQQIHTPGTGSLPTLTLQKFTPYAATGSAGTTFTFHGAMCTSWEIACQAGGIATIRTSWDCEDVDKTTSPATPSYPVSNLFSFKDATLLIGGTPSTAAGETTVSGGSTVPVSGVTITGTNALAVDRRFFGNAGLKDIPLEDDYSQITGSLAGEFRDATLHDIFDTDATSTLVLRFVGSLISGSTYETAEVILPAIKLNGETPQVGGPGLTEFTSPFEALDDRTNPVIQIRTISTDATV